MPDFVLALCFFSMLLVPCVVAFRNARIGHEGKTSDPSDVASEVYTRQAASGPALSRAELTAKRNRELYLRSVRELEGVPRP